MGAPLPAAGLCVLALALAGCGALDRAELKRGVESLTGIAAEGRLLADGAATDRTRSTYTRVHARDLTDDVDHEAEKLADATPQPGTGADRDRAVALAGRLSQALGTLQTSPGDERGAAQARRQLERVEGQLQDVARRLK
jgi:hypothetical protein